MMPVCGLNHSKLLRELPDRDLARVCGVVSGSSVVTVYITYILIYAECTGALISHVRDFHSPVCLPACLPCLTLPCLPPYRNAPRLRPSPSMLIKATIPQPIEIHHANPHQSSTSPEREFISVQHVLPMKPPHHKNPHRSVAQHLASQPHPHRTRCNASHRVAFASHRFAFASLSRIQSLVVGVAVAGL